jgi:hypothetical protein
MSEMSEMSEVRQARGYCAFDLTDLRAALRRDPIRLACSASPWRAASYLISYLVVSVVTFAVVVTVVATTASLAWTIIALPLLIVAAQVIHWCATVERGLLRQVHSRPVRAIYEQPTAAGLRTRVQATWRDHATWRELGYLAGLWAPLYALDTAVFAIWAYFLSWITLPLWYWAPWVQYHGARLHGYQLGFYFPHGPDGPGTVGFFIDTLPKALFVAAAGVVGFLIFNYVLVATAGLHARVARSLLGQPADPLADAKHVLAEPGPLGKLGQASG